MFFYFIDHDANVFDVSLIDSFGLRYALGSVRVQPVRQGPNGKKGFLLADPATCDVLRYRPDQQTWIQKFGDERVWIGHANDNLPRLPALAREKQLPGRNIILPDGSRILIPIARRWVEVDDRLPWAVALPQSLTRDESGRWVPTAVVSQYRHLWLLLCGYIDAAEKAIREADVAPGDSVFFQFERINELAIAAIAANYRVGADEIEICGCYTEEVRDAIIAVVKDDATREAWVKKKLAAMTATGGSSSSGAEPAIAASTPATLPVSPSCGPTPPDSTADEAS